MAKKNNPLDYQTLASIIEKFLQTDTIMTELVIIVGERDHTIILPANYATVSLDNLLSSAKEIGKSLRADIGDFKQIGTVLDGKMQIDDGNKKEICKCVTVEIHTLPSDAIKTLVFQVKRDAKGNFKQLVRIPSAEIAASIVNAPRIEAFTKGLIASHSLSN